MAEKVTIGFPKDMADQVRTVAARSQRSFDEVLVDWIRRVGSEPVLELLPGEAVLAVCDSQPDTAEQEELSTLLEWNQEGALLAGGRERVEELMRPNRTGLVRKAQALKLAVSRNLRPQLRCHGA